MLDLPDAPEGSPPKRCPVCNRRIHEPAHTYCTMRCSDVAKQSASAEVAREVAVLMAQYRAGKWLPVDVGSGRHHKKVLGEITRNS